MSAKANYFKIGTFVIAAAVIAIIAIIVDVPKKSNDRDVYRWLCTGPGCWISV